MEITRTANAGVLLKLDGVSVLLDGVCRELAPYPATPPYLRQRLTQSPPDLTAFTHDHVDHFDPEFAAQYCNRTLRPILGPESLPVSALTTGQVRVGPVTVTPIPSRHIGKAGQETEHVSFLIEGSCRILFTGDASPLNWDVPGGAAMPKADVLIANYAYATSAASWQRVISCGTKKVILLHLPEESKDEFGLWTAVRQTTAAQPAGFVRIPELGQTVCVPESF